MISGTPKYRGLRRIGEGGMAEVFSARMWTKPGFVKKVAIKRVLPRLGRNKLFLRMFMDEARLGLMLNHSNIVLCLDVGRAGDDHFIVMEYVDGVDLRQATAAYVDRGAMPPLEFTLLIAVEICRALSYAHNLSDARARPLNIVHHDINPSNVLLSLQGEVKVVDFGLSTAAMHLQRSDPDVVRGKFGYLSPEIAMGQGGDARSDIYALGIILWEMVTGERLFQGRDDMEGLRLARAAAVRPPRELNPDIPENLEKIILCALARDPADRFQDARHLGRSLTQMMFDLARPVSLFEVGDMVGAVRAFLAEPQLSPEPTNVERAVERELSQFNSLKYEGEMGPADELPF